VLLAAAGHVQAFRLVSFRNSLHGGSWCVKGEYQYSEVWSQGEPYESDAVSFGCGRRLISMDAQIQRLSMEKNLFERLGAFFIRYGLVLVLGWIGAMKFTSYEAEGIKTLV